LKISLAFCYLVHYTTRMKNKANEFGTREEILSNALSILEREIEWSLTEILPLAEVNKLLAPIRAKINKEIAK